MFLPHPRVKVRIVGSLRDREVACSASDRQGSNFEFCVWRTVSSQTSHHPQEVFLAQFSLYVHKGGLKPDSFHFISPSSGGSPGPIYPLCALRGIKLDSFHFHLESRRSRVSSQARSAIQVQRNKIFLIKFNIVESLPDREVACLGWDHQGSNFESCVRRAVSSIHLTILRLS